MDALSDVLRAVRLSGAVFFDVAATPPWVAEAPDGRTIVRQIFPSADHLISFHVVTGGRCWGGLIGGAESPLEPGDVIVFPHGDPHVMASARGMRGVPDPESYRPPADGRLPFTMTMGGRPTAWGPGDDAAGARADAGPAQIVCGFLGCDARPFNPLIASLPRVLHQRARAEGPLAQFVRMAVDESREPRIGGESVLGRLSELLFIDVVRHHLAALPQEDTGWLAALRDRAVGEALTLLHGRPEREWTIELLAHDVGVSRSVLAERFTAMVGQPPMQYLANWRMQQAASLLLNGVDTVASTASRVGYESEAAFSRAFKKIVGVPPGQWRRHKSGAPPAVQEEA